MKQVGFGMPILYLPTSQVDTQLPRSFGSDVHPNNRIQTVMAAVFGSGDR